MSRFIGLIILALGAYASYIVVMDQLDKQRVKTNPWVQKLKPLIDTHEKVELSSDDGVPYFTNKGSFYQLLALLHQSRKEKYDLEQTIDSVLVGAIIKDKHVMMREAILSNFKVASEMQLFDDIDNLERMQQGLAPVIHTKGWEDEPTDVGHIISPLHAPEAASSLINMIIMPESYRDLQRHSIVGFTDALIRRWREAGVINAESAKDIYDVIHVKKM
jgi:hypothetical protein